MKVRITIRRPHRSPVVDKGNVYGELALVVGSPNVESVTVRYADGMETTYERLNVQHREDMVGSTRESDRPAPTMTEDGR